MSRELDDLEREFADLEQGAGPGGGPSGPRRRGGWRTLPIAVAVIALVAFAGIVWYAYNQGVRSGSEDAAPILAPSGEAKVQPSDPGGMEIPHTDKEVFNRISGDEEPVDRVEQILPPPEDPMQPVAREPEEEAAPSAAPEVTTPAMPSITDNVEPVPPLPDEKLAEPAAEPPTAAPAPSSGGETATGPSDTAQSQQSQPTEPTAEAEPAAQAQPAPEPEPEAEASAQTAAVDPTSGWQVQIAALRSEADARTAWARLQKAHADELAVQRAVVNGTTYFRVRGGPLADRAAAKAVCDALAAKDQGCLVVKPGG